MDLDLVKELLSTRQDGIVRHRESQTLEFKENFNYAGLAEYFRDFAAFANNKGGWLIFGVKDRPRRELLGLSGKSQEQLEKLDPEKISGYLLDDFAGNISWEFDFVEIQDMKFGVFRVYESEIKPIICKKDESDTLKNGEIYYRYGGRTQKILYPELEAIINHRIDKQNLQWMDLVAKIAKSGPQNAAILDVEKGVISKNNAQILVVDEALAKSVKWIKEGHFTDTEGAPTLKLVGEVQPIETVEIVKKEKINRLREYPLSATELAERIRQGVNIPKSDIWRIIHENSIKSNPDYSIYNFRNKRQEEEYESSGKIPNGVPSIYKEAAIDYIINVYKNEH